MSVDLEVAIAVAVEELKAAGFEQNYIDAAVNAYGENIRRERERANKNGMRLAVSPLSLCTAAASFSSGRK